MKNPRVGPRPRHGDGAGAPKVHFSGSQARTWVPGKCRPLTLGLGGLGREVCVSLVATPVHEKAHAAPPPALKLRFFSGRDLVRPEQSGTVLAR